MFTDSISDDLDSSIKSEAVNQKYQQHNFSLKIQNIIDIENDPISQCRFYSRQEKLALKEQKQLTANRIKEENQRRKEEAKLQSQLAKEQVKQLEKIERNRLKDQKELEKLEEQLLLEEEYIDQSVKRLQEIQPELAQLQKTKEQFEKQLLVHLQKQKQIKEVLLTKASKPTCNDIQINVTNQQYTQINQTVVLSQIDPTPKTTPTFSIAQISITNAQEHQKDLTLSTHEQKTQEEQLQAIPKFQLSGLHLVDAAKSLKKLQTVNVQHIKAKSPPKSTRPQLLRSFK